ncbi:aldehyde dehydrogenase family protein [Mesorhizobium sp.]|uniref:aldehyde dehydrogenase family protein n=1 Tax=Mesorhizobium sp. TaxID=1871066 RepID=UPI0034155880
MGTAGQRCTTLRRLFVQESVYDKLVPRQGLPERLGRQPPENVCPRRSSDR